jgi:very-short-patch-repair endonuclease
LGKQGLPRNLVNQLITAARKMRSEQTLAEKRLWQHIRERQLGGYKFRRQQVIDRFIVDFYCSKAKLIIEVDGEIHLKQKGQDKARDKFLQVIGYQVIRFSNQDVQNNLPLVLNKVQTICSQRTSKAT